MRGIKALYSVNALSRRYFSQKVIIVLLSIGLIIGNINYVKLSYEVESRGEGSLLRIVQGDFSSGENAKQRFEESRDGWKTMVIPMMKELLGE